jgi:pyruvate dehydrogenase E1 component alpha subunit
MSSQDETGEVPAAGRDPRDPIQYLAPDGTPLPDADLPDIPDETLLGMYENLVFARRFDERAKTLQRQGRISTWAPMAGQEASQVASTAAMAERDRLYPTYRDNAAKFVHGTDPAAVLARLAGHVDSPDGTVDFAAGEYVLPESIPIASHLPHAVGGAMATDHRDGDAVHVAHFGDGATSEGDFHEALNFAGVYDVPAVFVCHNNGWAISVPREKQTASETLAQKAEAYGFEGVRVDGMDPLAVYDVTTDALGTARDAEGESLRPTMIEAVEYRLGAHTTADDPDVYRDGVPEEWRERDPVPRFETFLRGDGLLDDDRVATIADRVDERVADAVDRAESLEARPEGMFDHVYAERTPRLERQHAELERLRDDLGDDAFHRD